mmetsp:Transcript_23456/g.61439  ORF Transcript_23456/g.61439 Transcript_23456/m.61439 type:complete len:396 (+) Transcript_23456:302-1489(+)
MSRDGFDLLVYKLWDQAHGSPKAPGPLFRSHFYPNVTVKHKELPGKPPHGIAVTLQFNEGHWKSKRKERDVAQINPDVEDSPVVKKFNADKFHFGKMKEDEILVRFDHNKMFLRRDSEGYLKTVAENADAPHAVAINVSPLAVGHSLVLPWLGRSLPQYLDFQALSVAVRVMAECRHPHSRMLFNSLGGFSSVNHLHFHLLNMEGVSSDRRTPVERAALVGAVLTKRMHPGVTLRSVDTSAAGWGCAAVALTADPDAPIDVISAAVTDVTRELYRAKVPFHLLLVNAKLIYVLPRQNQAVQERSAGLRQAAFEVVGVQVCLGPDQWESTTCSVFMDRLRSTVSLRSSKLDLLVAKAGWAADGGGDMDWRSVTLFSCLVLGAALLAVGVQRKLART